MSENDRRPVSHAAAVRREPAAYDVFPDAPPIGRLGTRPFPALAGTALAQPSIRADGGQLGGRWIAAASISGQSHVVRGTSGQDAYCFALATDGSALVLAVCDGLGSRPDTAQVGAELLARFSCHHAARIPGAEPDPDRALAQAVERGNQDVLDCAAKQLPNWEPTLLLSTLLLCRLPLTPGAGPATVARVGDGEAFLLRGSEYSTVFPYQDDGGWINVVNAALPHDDPRSVLELAHADPDAADVLILATDGLANDVQDSPETREWLAGRWAVPCGPHAMITALGYRRQGSHDDRTALAVWLRPWNPAR